MQPEFSRLDIPFTAAFKHSSAVRTATQSVWVTARSGRVAGVGEGCPREYVTGESLASAQTFFADHHEVLVQDIDSVDALACWVVAHTTLIDANPAAWCAVELAMLELFARQADVPVERVVGVPPTTGTFQYSAVVGDGGADMFRATVTRYRTLGFVDFKLKLSGDPTLDRDKIDTFREVEHPERLRIRVDANNLWDDAETAVRYLQDLDCVFVGIEKVNQASALWARPKSEISEEQYQEFYKHVAHDFEPALAYTHAKVEGRQEYTVLLFVPQRAPFDLWDRAQRHGIKLYVRRVFIMDDAEQLMPAYLRFVRGVVDSNDLPLNLSRELLQHSRDVAAIRVASVKRILGLLEELAENDTTKYASFWREFGRVFKEGVGEDVPNRERVAKLLRFASTHADTDDQSVGLADYVGRMKDGQDKIYYITAESFAAARSSPHLEIFRKTGIEVLLLHDRVDEWVASHLTEFDGRSLQSVSQGDLDLGTLGEAPDPEKQEHSETEYTPLLERMQKALGPRTERVRLTARLTDSPACLVSDHGPSMNLERIL